MSIAGVRSCRLSRSSRLAGGLSYDRGMANDDVKNVTRADLIAALNDDLSREYQAIIAYVVYSQTIKGAQYMAIKEELEKHAKEELAHALTVAKSIGYLGGTITATPKPVKTSDK